MGGSATEGGEGEKASFLNVAAAETLGEEVAAPEETSFWGVEGGKSVVCCRGAGGNAERSAAGRKTVVSVCRAVADPLGGSATEDGEGEKASFLNVAASEATAIEPPPEEKPSFPFAAASGEALSAKSSEEKPSFPVTAASEATSFWERRVAGGNVDRAVVEEKRLFPGAAPSPTLWAEAR